MIFLRKDVNNIMKFYKVSTHSDTKITGNNTGTYSVEINDKKSFLNNDEKEIFNNFFRQSLKDSKRKFEGTFVEFETEINKIKLFPISKKVKEIDFILHSPHKVGLSFVISEKVLNIIKKFELSRYNLIPIEIDTFVTKYFLIGFPIIQKEETDFSKSIFYNDKIKQETKYLNYEDYSKNIINSQINKLFLIKKFDYHIINTIYGLFFSENLINEIVKEDVTGLRIYNDIILEI
jgi:hypothetical protein